MIDKHIAGELAPSGILRAAINLSNPLLVTGTAANGDPQGISPDMARFIADRLGIAVKYVTFASPGELADGLTSDAWDIGLIAIEPARAETIRFSPAYVEIEATYLVPPGSPFTAIEQVDSKGTRIALSARSAYDLYLTRSLQNAGLVRARGLGAAFDLFVMEKLHALAGLRPALLDDSEKMPGSKILPGKFTSVLQAIGTHPDKKAGAAFLQKSVQEAISSGLVKKLIEKHGVSGKLSVAETN